MTSLLNGCISERIETTIETVEPSTKITWLGEPTHLEGKALKVGEKFPSVGLIDTKMQTTTIGKTGTVRVISTIPSIDTPVCDLQAHELDETKVLKPEIQRIMISRDLPYAQRRFQEKSSLDKILFLSDYKYRALGEAIGLQIERNGLLARAVIVVDKDDVVRYLQVTPEITQMPDMDRAFKFANEL